MLVSLVEILETYPSFLAWKVSWIEEPGGLQSMGPQRVGHNLSTHKHTISLEETKSSLVHMVAENTMLYSVKLKLELHWLLLPPFHISESVVTCILRLPSCFVLFLS